MMDNYDLDYFKNFVSPEALEEFLDPRIFSRDILLDDPIDFINGFNLALAFINKDEFPTLHEEARFRVGLGLWLNRYINRIENQDWR